MFDLSWLLLKFFIPSRCRAENDLGTQMHQILRLGGGRCTIVTRHKME